MDPHVPERELWAGQFRPGLKDVHGVKSLEEAGGSNACLFLS